MNFLSLFLSFFLLFRLVSGRKARVKMSLLGHLELAVESIWLKLILLNQNLNHFLKKIECTLWARNPTSRGAFFFFNLFTLFIYFWLHWVFIVMCGLSLVVASGVHSLLRCAGLPLQWPLLLQSTGPRCMGFSSCASRALERRLSSCGTRAQLLHGMWDPPGPGLEPVSPALAGGFPTTGPPGKL